MSQLQELIKLAYNKGYRIYNGECYSPKNKIIKGSIKTHPIPYRQLSIKTKNGARAIPYHALLAYQLYKEEYFKDGIVARHLNGNSLDNSENNIILGTQKDNKLDLPIDRRREAIYKGIATKELIQNHIDDIKQDYINGMGAKQLYKKYNTSLNMMYILIRNNFIF